MKPQVHRMPESVCPKCGNRLNSASQDGPEPNRPVPGDVSICFTCGRVDQFGPDMKLLGRTYDQVLADCSPAELANIEALLHQLHRKGFAE